jgi:hypothetical protein
MTLNDLSQSVRFALRQKNRADGANKTSDLWPAIWTAGGLCWLCVALIGVLWAWPITGTLQGGQYVVGSGARLIYHCLLFLLAAPCYRLGLGLGWPDGSFARARVILANALLALIVVRLTPFVLIAASAVADRSLDYVMVNIQYWGSMQLGAPQWLTLLRFWLLPYVLGLVAVALLITARRSQSASVQLAELSVQLANARMSTLSAQLHPHFLFNSLHAISELVTDSPSQAVVMIARLGDFLRIALESAKNPWTSVEAEVMGLEAYLEVQRTRFRDQLQVELTAEPQALTTQIPALLLQPLVENAIEHGLSDADGCLQVVIAIRQRRSRLAIVVTNSNPRIPRRLQPAEFGNGLRNVNARLFAAYGFDARMTIGPDVIGGTRAELEIPATVQEWLGAAEHAN